MLYTPQDPSAVQAHQPPKAVTVEDSFKSCTSLEAASTVLHLLAPDLLYRLQEEFQVGCCQCTSSVRVLPKALSEMTARSDILTCNFCRLGEVLISLQRSKF